MGIDIAAKKAGIELERDVPRQGQRRTRDWAKLIGTARKLEAADQEAREESHKKIEELSIQVAELIRENANLQRQVDHYHLKDRMREIELQPKDVAFLLDRSKSNGNDL